jgi:Ca-activated chloride channel homolog
MTTRPATSFALNRARSVFSLLPLSLFLFVSSVHAQNLPVFRGSTDVVVVPVTVTDGSGRFVRGLTADQFEILDNGNRRVITQFSADRAPVSLGILLDISGSMSQVSAASGGTDARWADTRRSLELLVTRLGDRDEVFLAAFSDKVGLAVPWTRDHRRILPAFDALQTGGNTALFNAVKLIAPAFRLARHQRKVLLLISDGDDNSVYVAPRGVPVGSTYMGVTIHQDPDAAVAERQGLELQMRTMAVTAESRTALNESGALLYAIGMGTRKGAKVDRSTLAQLTRDSGGYVEPVLDPAAIPEAVARICDDLQAQYLLAFEPGLADGQFHRLSVSVKGRGLNVRARSGYVAAQK